ncbi:HAD-superfamily hydrolase [methanogenic archaeon mixed culture ISO4-G1]|nr:HAD-superfamily hydrolase [methanogenic archaeon mixed culture ISO4-G1]
MRPTGFMIDMDGTVYKGGDLIPGATDFIAALKAKGIPFVFLTNNSSHSRSYYYEKLRRMGFDVTIDNVLTSNIATSRFVLSERPGKRVYVVGSPDVTEEVRAAGVDVVEDDPDIVYLTFDRTITYEKINRAFKALRNGAELIATHPDDVCPTETDYDIDIGPFIRMFEQMCQTTAVVIGKPNRLMLEMAALEMGVDPNGTVMVGDRLYTDMRMGVDAGTDTILVLSGETSREDLEASDIRPTYVLDSVADIPGLL